MTLVHYEPWALVDRLRRLDRAFASSDATTEGKLAWLPAVDVHEETERFVVRADLPGVEPKDIEITTDKGVLTLRGERRTEQRAEESGRTRFERVSGTFVRHFTLPENAQPDAIKATHVNGVLEVTIPKQPKPEPRRIKVEAA
jgi:HSP20 family protein